MAVKALCSIFGIRFTPKALARLAFIEISILAIVYFVLIILRYATSSLSHDFFVELMLIVGIGMVFDHYSITVMMLCSDKR